jgi:hypothetical protein
MLRYFESTVNLLGILFLKTCACRSLFVVKKVLINEPSWAFFINFAKSGIYALILAFIPVVNAIYKYTD